MKVIYHDKSGRHLAIIAAAMHLQTIKEDFSSEDLYGLPYFMNTKEPGILLYLGLDAKGNEIYVLGRGRAFPVIRNAATSLNHTFSLNQDFVFADVGPVMNWRLKLFDLLHSRSSGQKRLDKMVYIGLKKATPNLFKLVQEVQKTLRHGEELV